MTPYDYAGRQERVWAAMRAAGVDVLAVSPGDDLRYLIGYTPHRDERACLLLLAGAQAAFLVPELNATQAREHVQLPIFTYADSAGPEAAARDALGSFASPRTVAVADDMRADELLLLQRLWPDARYRPGSEVTAPLRMQKSAEEIAELRRAARVADAGVVEAFRALRPGITERDLAEISTRAMREAGARGAAFDPIVGTGPNSAYPHHATSDRAVRAGEPVLMDTGGRVGGYVSDITRMAFLGQPPARYREVHAVVEEAVRAAIAAARPGAPLRDVDRAAREVITRAGYGQYFTHRTGHGIGLSEHEPPSVHGDNPVPIEEGMAFTIEPGIYLPGEFGVRLEEAVVITAAGSERLSELPRDAWVVPA